jgi:hypothetical protein
MWCGTQVPLSRCPHLTAPRARVHDLLYPGKGAAVIMDNSRGDTEPLGAPACEVSTRYSRSCFSLNFRVT